jgi:macrolide transport system ATP-binding/permease protein
MLFALDQITHAFGASLILDGISLVARAGDRIGIIGANGAGKSTLLQVAAGRLAPDSGRVQVAPLAEVGYVPQTVAPAAGQRIADLLAAAQQRVLRFEQQMHALAEEMATVTAGEQAALVHAYGEAAARFEQAGGYALDYRIDAVLHGLRLGHLSRERLVATLSGGEKTRVVLAALLLCAPDVLLLDEPTNHLDAASADWLADYLRQQRGTVLVVSHDRRFLDQIATQIAELDEHTHQLRSYGGGYSDYLVWRQREQRAQAEAYARQQAEIATLRQQASHTTQRLATTRPRRDGDKLTYNFKGQRAQGSMARDIRNAEQRLARILADPLPPPPEPLRFAADFAPAAQASGTLLRLDAVHVAFGDQTIVRETSLDVGAGERLLIMGENGAGKTTLLRLLAGDLLPDQGTVWRSEQAAVGYLSQEDVLAQDERSVLAVYRAGRVGYAEALQAELLRFGLFRPADVQRPVCALSVGQRRKVQLACLLARPCNLLLLDEPTNQFSLDVVEQIEQALGQFSGAVVAVSHDRQFCAQFRGARWRLAAGQLEPA